ncbi:MAG: putative DNA binding domain-containing protein [Ignavibacteriaceae bacterium]|nr:putative DNA binding domain-containing protein [Ignavibacteriaceae bacterium]
MTERQAIERLKELLSLPGETEVVEFKEAKNSYDFSKLGKYFSALCNEANLLDKTSAWLIFGVENSKREIVGTKYRQDNRPYLDSLKGEIANKTTNRITFVEIYELNLAGGRRVVMMQIPAAPRGLPVAWEGHYYGRDGGELVPLNLVELEKIRQQAGKKDWSSEICKEATIKDLSKKAIKLARSNFKIKNPRIAAESDKWNDEVFLDKAKITINGRITRTAIILLGKPESGHFISPAVAGITWILRDKDKFEKDYAHFSCPFIVVVDEVFSKIRNLKYRYIKSGTLFPEEVDQFDPFSIREALNNCIAHQDYTQGGRINVVERDDGYLTFTNLGEFLPGSIEQVIKSDSPPEYYRNQFLVQAMVNLNMIDTVGSGIKRMFRLQSQRYFPMPDYDLSGGRVKATLIGKVLDIDYARVLAQNPDLTLDEIILLDKIQKKKHITEEEILQLKTKGLVEGRKPNFHISQKVAEKTNQKAEYILNRGFKDQHYKGLILEFIDKYGSATKDDLVKLLFDLLPQVLDDSKKKNKVRNLIYAMSKRDKTIENTGTKRKPAWKRKI